MFLKRKKIEGKEIWDDDHDDNGDEIQKCAKKNKQKHRFCVNTFNTPEKCLKAYNELSCKINELDEINLFFFMVVTQFKSLSN